MFFAGFSAFWVFTEKRVVESNGIPKEREYQDTKKAIWIVPGGYFGLRSFGTYFFICQQHIKCK
jgi:hypothetical protein